MGVGNFLVITGGAAVGGAAAVAMAPVMLGVVGFTPVGIAFYYAASMMSAGTLVAVLQWAGRAALSVMAAFFMAIIRGFSRAVVGWLKSKIYKKKDEKGEKEERKTAWWPSW